MVVLLGIFQQRPTSATECLISKKKKASQNATGWDVLSLSSMFDVSYSGGGALNFVLGRLRECQNEGLKNWFFVESKG